jgi:type I site-specific restriction endonuclease
VVILLALVEQAAVEQALHQAQVLMDHQTQVVAVVVEISKATATAATAAQVLLFCDTQIHAQSVSAQV